MRETPELKKRRLGRTGLQVTELGLGCYQYTGEFNVAQQEAGRILDLAFEAGINFFDTAEMYGFGESEELLGRALARHPGRKAHLSDKVGWLDRTVVRNLVEKPLECARHDEKVYRNEDALRRAIEHSFWLLRRDYIDLFMIHEPNVELWWGMDRKTGDAVVTRVLEDYKRQGRIGGLGLGGWDCDHMADLIETGRFDAVLVAGGVNLLGQPIKSRVLPAAQKHDVGVILGGVLGQGGLVVADRAAARKLIDDPSDPSHPTRGRKLLAAYDLAEETGLGMVELAMRYVLGMPEIHTHITGARERAHLEANLVSIAKGPLPPEIVSMIEAIAHIQ
jgi:aryl-alcohol dehydrogenase-like predicted oxidoreductase